MKLRLSLLSITFLITSGLATAQNCENCRYISPIFDSVTIETVHFGEGVNVDGDLQQLYMDVYQPFGDTETARPVIMSFHGE